MLVGWGVLLPAGVTMTRIKHLAGDPMWYKLHRGIQIVGLSIALAGFIIALQHFDMNKISAHGALGITVMAGGLFQPLNGFLRPHKGDPNRSAWEMLHKNVGRLTIVLALVTVFMGVGKFDRLAGEHFPGTAMALGATCGTVVLVLVMLILYGKVSEPSPQFKPAPKGSKAHTPGPAIA